MKKFVVLAFVIGLTACKGGAVPTAPTGLVAFVTPEATSTIPSPPVTEAPPPVAEAPAPVTPTPTPTTPVVPVVPSGVQWHFTDSPSKFRVENNSNEVLKVNAALNSLDCKQSWGREIKEVAPNSIGWFSLVPPPGACGKGQIDIMVNNPNVSCEHPTVVGGREYILGPDCAPLNVNPPPPPVVVPPPCASNWVVAGEWEKTSGPGSTDPFTRASISGTMTVPPACVPKWVELDWTNMITSKKGNPFDKGELVCQDYTTIFTRNFADGCGKTQTTPGSIDSRACVPKPPPPPVCTPVTIWERRLWINGCGQARYEYRQVTSSCP